MTTMRDEWASSAARNELAEEIEALRDRIHLAALFVVLAAPTLALNVVASRAYDLVTAVEAHIDGLKRGD